MSFEGTLQDLAFNEVLGALARNGRTGILYLIGLEEEGFIYVEHGEIKEALTVCVEDNTRAIAATREQALTGMWTWQSGHYIFDAQEALADPSLLVDIALTPTGSEAGPTIANMPPATAVTVATLAPTNPATGGGAATPPVPVHEEPDGPVLIRGGILTNPIRKLDYKLSQRLKRHKAKPAVSR